MARFNFRLQSVLNLKKALEEQQKHVFHAAKRKLDEEEEKLQSLFSRLGDYEEEGRKMRSSTLSIMDIIDNENAILRIKEYIEEQKTQVALAKMRLEAEREKLVEMMKERKTYEKLREKAYENYLSEEKHEEMIVNDEHNSYVYGVN